ncbi:hypothetical protein Emag_000531 [Eimeria magna]
MQTVRAKDQGVADVGYKEISFGLCVFVAPPVVRDVLRYRAHLELRAGGYAKLHRLIQRLCPHFRLDRYAGASSGTSISPRAVMGNSAAQRGSGSTSVPLRRAGEDDFLPDYCPPHVLYSRTAFRRLGPPDLDRTFASPTLWEGPHFADYRGFSRESVFAVSAGPGRVMQSGKPCWLVVCSLRDVHREMVYDRAMQEIFPRHDLRRFVEIPFRLCPRNMDMEYSYAVAPYRVESEAQLVFLIPMEHGIRDSLAEVASEEDRARGSEDDEPGPPSPVISLASTASTSVGGSPPGNTSPRRAPEAPEPPKRRRRLEPHSALFPATPEPVDEAQLPSAPANEDSAGADAGSSADASHSTSPWGR